MAPSDPPSLAPSPKTQCLRRTAKGKSVDPAEKRPKPKPKPAAKKHQADSNKAGSSKRRRTSKDANMTVADIGQSERSDLDVPMDSFDESAEDGGESEDQTEGGWVGGSQRITEVLKKQILQWYFGERWQENKKDVGKSIKQLEVLVKYQLKNKAIADLITREHRWYATYNRLVMKTGGGKDDFVTKEEIKSRYERLNVDRTFDYWMKYGESWEFKTLHAVEWDADDVCKFSHVDSVTSTASDSETTPSSSPKKKKSKSRKAKGVGSGSETEREVSQNSRTKQSNISILGFVMESMESLTVNQDRQAEIAQKTYELEVRKADIAEATQKEQLLLNRRSRGIEDFVKLAGSLNHPDKLVSSLARGFMVQLKGDLDVPLGGLAPAALAHAPSTAHGASTLVAEVASTLDATQEPLASGSGSSSN